MSEQATVGHKRILLADDQEDVRETVKLLLGMDGHTVVEACNGREALDLFHEGKFDLVITDYAMPQMRGDELAANVKQESPEQPVLMITGSVEKFGVPDAAVDKLLNKPFTFEELRAAVSQVLCAQPTQV
jgi:CheY-like chemotaxis protein